jgi:hypothetical protein
MSAGASWEGHQRHQFRFGDVGAEISEDAGMLNRLLWDEPERRSAEALMWLGEIEFLWPLVEVPIDVATPGGRQAFDARNSFHDALPFQDAERRWLVSRIREEHRSEETTEQLLMTSEGQIMMAGVKRAISGRDLMRRWAAWLAQTDEFEGQDSLGQARTALAAVEQVMN